MQDADQFGIPTVQSTRSNDYSDPEDGRYHFRLFNVPTHVDLGVVFGKCGHYLCHACCNEYKKSINTATTCYYCRDPTVINLDTLAETDQNQAEDDTDQPGPHAKKARSESELSPGTQLQCMFSLLQKL
jgi:hypothetical protein